MKKHYLNAAVASLILQDISDRFMSFHDDINDLKLSENNYDADTLLIKFFGANVDEKQLPLIKAILSCLCEYAETTWQEEHDVDIEIDGQQLEFEFEDC